MHRYTNCIAHRSSEGILLAGETHTALFDCGMAFCAEETIARVKAALGTRPLDYLFMSHTHYDHIGALPFFRAEWPGLRAVTCEAGAVVLLKDTPRRVIRELSGAAALKYGNPFDGAYDDDAFHADVIVKEGDVIPLGGLSVETLETPGHTRDSLSWFIPELKLLFLNETTGVLLPDGYILPCCLTGFASAVKAIEKCSSIDYAHLSFPHRGIIAQMKAADYEEYFDRARQTLVDCRAFILDMNDKGFDEDEMIARFTQEYATDTLLQYQPMEAFLANAKAMIGCAVREG